MKKKSTSQSAPAHRSLGEGGFLNLRVLFGLCVMLAGVFLALVSFGTFSSVLAQTNETNPIQPAAQPANDAPGTDLSSADLNRNRQLAPPPRVISGREVNLSDWLQGPKAPAPNEAWGSQPGLVWIAASQFAVRNDSTAPVLTQNGFQFYNSPNSAVPQRYFAQLTVEPGHRILGMLCLFRDNSLLNSVEFQWQKFTTNLGTGVSNATVLDSFTSSGTPGFGIGTLGTAVPETMHVLDPASGGVLINHYIAADIAGDTSFAGCFVQYQRQVAPGPATATFSDVPTSSPWFQYVEALVDTNVTSGCAPNLYCPNDPITRGQMAVFLAKALGMGFPF